MGYFSSLLGVEIESQKNPEILLNEMRARQKELLQKPVSVWGIETPTVVSVQYGSGEYQVPTSFIANALLYALAPLLIGWVGSVYMTRQRELLVLREIRDYKIAFPHVMNVLPVIFESLPILNAERYKKSRERAIGRAVDRFVTCVVRSCILLLFLLPMILIFSYSIVELMLPRKDVGILELLAAGFVVICLLVQSIQLVWQEWVVLWGKEYYA